MIFPAPAAAAALPRRAKTGSTIPSGLLRFRLVRTEVRMGSCECSGQKSVIGELSDAKTLTLGYLTADGERTGRQEKVCRCSENGSYRIDHGDKICGVWKASESRGKGMCNRGKKEWKCPQPEMTLRIRLN